VQNGRYYNSLADLLSAALPCVEVDQTLVSRDCWTVTLSCHCVGVREGTRWTVIQSGACQGALLESQRELREVNVMLNELSVRDGLTGLYNRRHFDGALETELRRAVRHLKRCGAARILSQNRPDCWGAMSSP
jgi:predicted signal transduction protein with EAL and GGDEF domain